MRPIFFLQNRKDTSGVWRAAFVLQKSTDINSFLRAGTMSVEPAHSNEFFIPT